MPTEYVMEGIFSTKSDVYNFGILMLAIVSGKRNNSFHNENSSLTLVGHVSQTIFNTNFLHDKSFVIKA